MTKNAFVTIIGRPNVGKSSLLNALIGERIAAVSAKPQTTRTKITGVLTKGDTQYVFIDTPGMHRAKNKLSEHMVKTINDSVAELETALLVIDCTKGISEPERVLASEFSKRSHVILVVNKIDLLEDKSELIAKLSEYSQLYDFAEIIPVSVLEADGLELVMQAINKFAVEGPHYFPDDMLTDQPEKVIMAEMIREKALNNLNDEIPHGIAVTIESLNERTDSSGEDILDISATIYCERESHKGIVIGKGGSMLRKIGADARAELEAFFAIKVNLQCWVKVKEGWRNREALIKNFGLD
ncbi:GTP-binding protein Era [Ruminococcaceae bacterium FB2012]|nr:GTP-binding protein Era [Ruminococcaceae bacterium FB2012]